MAAWLPSSHEQQTSLLFNSEVFWPKVTAHKHQIFPFINSLKILKCATNQDCPLLTTLLYIQPSNLSSALLLTLSDCEFEQNLYWYLMSLLICAPFHTAPAQKFCSSNEDSKNKFKFSSPYILHTYYTYFTILLQVEIHTCKGHFLNTEYMLCCTITSQTTSVQLNFLVPCQRDMMLCSLLFTATIYR